MATIGVFDSGVGGLSVWRELYKALPGADYLYFADNAYSPYGDKSEDQIQDRAREITDWLLFHGADIIVVACNTATAAAIQVLREEYGSPEERVRVVSQGRRDHVKFIGMEPAVKPAALGTRSGVIGVLATAGTLKASKYLNTKGRFADGVSIVEHVGEGFVELVEAGELTGPKAEAVVRASVEPLVAAGADTIVLGCTHYPFLRETIARVAGPDVRLIDPAPAVARQLMAEMQQEGLPLEREGTGAPKMRLKATGSDKVLKELYNLIWRDYDHDGSD